MEEIINEIEKLLYNYEKPKRKAFSSKYPFLIRPIIFFRQVLRNVHNFFSRNIYSHKENDFYAHIIARHQSILRRRLGNSDSKLQDQKIINLKQAIAKLNGIIIPPGKIFSFWNIVGKPSYKDGYVNGMLISNGKVVEGIGGGLCQLSNLLFWLFLHSPVEIIERHHHSMDIFPDSGRTLPFGSGATILYNFRDLRIKNTSVQPLQLKLWLTEGHLKGRILSCESISQNYHVFEKNHYYVKRGKQYFRYNEIYREIKIEGKITLSEKIATNFALVLYKTSDEKIKKNGFELLLIN